ncbi:hypothetical protein SPSIL_047820 [Sporomusa silvacetica DSM 10669]|uniref:Uncharacterized protein n=1 Tax=Sporomusa silvacetica DSM 10669 TaxID=1123289 RepID=A0ABZ3IS69_9FIRM|nr:hypothetical protein [Sporomusa silvacetica]OZC14551.1 hypothetical protein SPSIL_47020 [Sporomusa silvacetica DSM 10669]
MTENKEEKAPKTEEAGKEKAVDNSQIPPSKRKPGQNYGSANFTKK